MQSLPVMACEYCGEPVQYGELDCRNCGALVYRRHVEEIAGDAMQLERVNPPAAAMVWRKALDVLPRNSRQYADIYERIRALAAGWSPVAAAAGAPAHTSPVPQRLPSRHDRVLPPDPWPLAFAKTAGSMLVAMAVYYLWPFHDWVIAFGFVVLMLVHEMGHVLATWYFGLSASPPIFIPFVGAIINLREQPPNALVESVIGMGGPLLGTIGALVWYAIALAVPGPWRESLLDGAQLAFILNLFNLIPVPPLDGGRITAAISPWIWVAGLAGLAAFIVLQAVIGSRFGLLILLLVLFAGFRRVRDTLQARDMKLPYYDISPAASWIMGTLYVGLGVLLTFMIYQLGGLHRLGW
jgi:Zn-dependent protease